MFASGEVSGVMRDFVRDIRRDAIRCQQQVHDVFVGSYFVRGSMDRIDIDGLCGGVGPPSAQSNRESVRLSTQSSPAPFR